MRHRDSGLGIVSGIGIESESGLGIVARGSGSCVSYPSGDQGWAQFEDVIRGARRLQQRRHHRRLRRLDAEEIAENLTSEEARALEAAEADALQPRS